MNSLFENFPLWALASFGLAGFGWLFLMTMTLRQHLHWLQLEDYSPARMFAFSRRRWAALLFGAPFYSLPIASLTLRQCDCGWGMDALAAAFWAAGAGYEGYVLINREKSAKKRLVMTARAKRIFAIGFILSLIGLKAIGMLFPDDWFGAAMIGSMYLTTIFAGGWLSAAVGLLWPWEKFNQNRYLSDARRILAEVRPLIIGVTGSYGKTGTKELLAAMLADRYNVYRPPGSYNTLMGVTRAIREGLRPYHEAFVVEMGAYHEGSIRKLCGLTHPMHGIITVIGVQHLERFGSQKAIQRAKGELIQALPLDGVAVLNGDDPLCREIGEGHPGEVIYFKAIDGSEADSPGLKRLKSVAAVNIRVSATGSDFDIVFPDGEALSVHLSLLGRAAVFNALAATAMADRLGVSRQGIARTLAVMPHVRHRLEPLTGEGGVTVIDDAFNSNPVGAAGALEVLGLATRGRRILVTPGMVELGGMEEEANRTFGSQAARACDLAVLVGVRRIEPIKQGMLQEGFDEEKIWVVPSLKEGMKRLEAYLQPGDTMLLENDLPDQYEGM